MARGKYQEWLEPDKLILIEGWARDGLTDEQIATNMGVVYSTLRVWKDKYPALSAALKSGKEVVDREVENALLKKARGYSYKETTLERLTDKNTGVSCMVVTKVVEKEVVPDTTAQIFWLKNRKPQEWRDKRVFEDNGSDKADKLIQNMQTIADVLRHPAADRVIDDFEHGPEDE